MKKLGRLIGLVSVMVLLPAGPVDADRPLESETSHTPGTEFVYPMLEGWEGPITGGVVDLLEDDGTGWIEWWFDVETWTAWPYVSNGELPPNASHYRQQVRIYDHEGGELLLVTEEHGTTTLANTSWRANGEVVHCDQLPELVGRTVHESGRFTIGPFGPEYGESIFRLN